MKRFLGTAFLSLLLIGAIPVAHAQETMPKVSSLTELQDAIIQAEEGDKITITQTILIDTPVTVGVDGKPVTLVGAEGVETLLRFEGDWGLASYCWLYDLTIEGTGLPDGSKIVVSTPNSVYATRLTWVDCATEGFGAGMRIDQGEVYPMDCTFINCSADIGGAIYADTNTSLYPSSCTFSGCTSKRDGGALYAMGSSTIDNCTFTNNSSVNGNGGAIAGINLGIKNSTIKGNRALSGGGVFLSGSGIVQNCKLYDNTGELSADDLLSDGTVAISADDYVSLFSEELTTGGYDSFAWYVDIEGNRYSEDNITEALTETDSLTAPALKFVLYKEVAPEPEPEPEPTPEPEPDPKPSRPSTGGNHRPSKPEPPEEPKPTYPTLACGKAVIDRDAVIYLTDALKRFTAAQEQLTRGKFAAFLYGILSDESRLKCDHIAVYSYDDLYGSPYEDSVAALTGAGVFCGDCNGLFCPTDMLTYGQLLTALTRFVAPQKGYIGSFNVLDHWAAPAAITAASYGWIDDVPIDLNAPATYGAFVNLLIKIYNL